MNSNLKGLTSDEAKLRLEKNGRNALSPPKKRSPFLKYLDKVCGLFNLLLILAGILAIILYFLDSSEPVNVLHLISGYFTSIDRYTLAPF
jgi:sodium/potassium-transporting ATPase subunit alpha